MFTKAQLDRYARHIILPGVGAVGQKKLLDSKVLVIGAGGLGAPVLLYLAAAGIGQIGIVDFDRVDVSNLQRQVIHSVNTLGQQKTDSAKEALNALNPETKIETYGQKLDAGNARNLIKDYDLLVDGSDNFPTRYLVNDACVLEGKPLVYGAISQFEGQVSVFHADTLKGKSPCYRCLFPTPPEPGSIPNCEEAGVFGVLPGVIGSLMATEVLKYLLGLGDSLAGRLLHYDALAGSFHTVALKRQESCVVCGEEPSVKDLIDYEVFCGYS